MEKEIKVSKLIPSNYDYHLPNCLFDGVFQKEGNKQQSVRLLQAFDDHFLIFKNTNAKQPSKIVQLTFETKFELLRNSSVKTELGHPEAIRIEHEFSSHTITYFSADIVLLKQWRDYLAQRINQRGFHQAFKAQRKIGKGNFASVYLANRLEDGRNFAVKAFSKEVSYSLDQGKEAIKNEIKLMRQLDHPSILRLHEVYETENSLYMVLDLLEGGSFYDKIKHGARFSQLEIQLLIRALLQGISIMHSKRIMHRDLKPENILFRKRNSIQSVCIVDFGLATNADQPRYLYTRCGTPGFVAPEVFNCNDPNAHYDPICDVFSIGLIFYMLLTSTPAFPGKSYNDVVKMNRQCEIILGGSLFQNVPKLASDLLFQMIKKDPAERISADRALKHLYFVPVEPISTQNDGQEIQESLESQLKRFKDESTQFDIARLNQLQKVNLPIVPATSRFKKNDESDQEFVMKIPQINGQTEQITDSPQIIRKSSQSADNYPTNGEKILVGSTSPLHVLSQQLNHHEESKTQGINVMSELSKNI